MNIKETVARGLVIAGLATSGGSAVDFAQNNKALQQEMQTHSLINDSLRKQYGIETTCAPSFDGVGGACMDIALGDTPEERRATYLAYERERDEKFKATSDPEAETRGVAEAAGFVGGILVAAFAGQGLPDSKEKKK